MGTESINDVISRLENGLKENGGYKAWLKNLGVPESADFIERNLESIHQKQGRLLDEANNNELSEYYWAFGNIANFNAIFKSFYSYPNKKILKEKLSLALSTQNINTALDSDPNSNRNYLFELEVASNLRNSSIDAYLEQNSTTAASHDENANPDIYFEIDQHSYFIECKRPSADFQETPTTDEIIKRIRNTMDKAAKQLKKRMNLTNNDNSVGIICISLSNILGSYQQVVLEEVLESDWSNKKGDALWATYIEPAYDEIKISMDSRIKCIIGEMQFFGFQGKKGDINKTEYRILTMRQLLEPITPEEKQGLDKFMESFQNV